MKIIPIIFGFIMIQSTTVFAFDDDVYIYKNDKGCTVQVSKYGKNYQVTGAKQVNGRTKQAELFIRQDYSDAKITAYCSDYRRKNTFISRNINDDLVVSCLNETGKVTVDLGRDLKLTKFIFEGKHFYRGLPKDDSFSCENLVLRDILSY